MVCISHGGLKFRKYFEKLLLFTNTDKHNSFFLNCLIRMVSSFPVNGSNFESDPGASILL